MPSVFNSDALRDLAAGGLAGAGLGAIAGILPDIIEAPTHPNHRGLFHSAELATVLPTLALKVGFNSDYAEPMFTFGMPAVAAYWLHLVRDSDTPQSLPRYLLS